MSKPLPPYEKLVRWSIKEVTDWLTLVNLGQFKDQFSKQNIDGSRLTKLTEFDVDNFIGKEKKKSELKNFISNIQKPKNTQSKPTWISPTPRQQPVKSSHVPDDDSDTDSIYSWGDDFSDEGGDNHINNDDDETYVEPADDADDADDAEDYLFPISKEQQAPPLPKNRGPLPTPTPTSIPLLPGQIIPTTSTTKKVRTLPKPPNESAAEKGAKSVTPLNGDVYDDPDAEPEPRKNKTAQSRPGRRPPPPIPSTEPEGELYMNESEIKTKQNMAYSKTEQHVANNNNDGYIKFQQGPPREQQPDIYIDPEDELVPEQPKTRKSLPIITSPKQTPSSERKISLPPIPSSSKIVEVNQDALSSFDWYHHDADRKEAEDRLKVNNSNGMFLVRKSAKGGKVHPYTLMLFYKSKVFNFPVRKQDGQFALGKESKPDDLNFPSVPALIQYFQRTKMILIQGWTTTLSKPLEKLF